MRSARPQPPPGPRGIEVLRFFGNGSFANTLAYFEELARRYGPIASFTVLGRRLHLVTAPELVREVLVVQQHTFARANGAVILRDLVGYSMLTVDEPRHREKRRMLAPAFHAQRLARYGEPMIVEAQRTIEVWRDGAYVDLSAAMMRLALAIVGRALFGSDVAANAGALEAPLARAMRVLSWLGPILEVVPPWANDLRVRLPLPANRRLADARREMATIVARVIEARSGADADDLLALLMRARPAEGGRPDAAAIADELVTILLAGHETTANALAWSFYALARDADLSTRVAEEIAAAAGSRDIEVGDLAQLRLTGHVFAEALRLYPPASAFGRRALTRCTLAGYAVAAGDGIILSPYVSHRNAEIFPEPERFNPDRWVDFAPPSFAYFPFGGGARVCIGEGFARLEGTLVLATILRRFALHAIDDAPIGIAAHATLRPARPIVQRVERRS